MPIPEAILDIEALLVPISGDNPAGSSIHFTGSYDAIREARRWEDQFADAIEGEIKTADWPQVIQIGTEVLQNRSKDLQIAVWLVEALVNLHGFSGVQCGLDFIRQLHEQYWENLFPEMEDGDVEGRANALAWMDREISALITQIPFSLGLSNHVYTFAQWKDSEKYKIPEKMDDLESDEQNRYSALKATAEAENKITSEQWRIAKNTTSSEFYQQLMQVLEGCWKSFKALDRTMDETYGRQTPGLNFLSKTLEEMRDLVGKILREKGAREARTTLDTLPIPGTTGFQTVLPGAFHLPTAPAVFDEPGVGIRTRQAALDRLAEVAAFYKATEPHSPVPYLIERAIRWSHMSLEDWLREALKDEVALGTVRETLGLLSR